MQPGHFIIYRISQKSQHGLAIARQMKKSAKNERLLNVAESHSQLSSWVRPSFAKHSQVSRSKICHPRSFTLTRVLIEELLSLYAEPLLISHKLKIAYLKLHRKLNTTEKIVKTVSIVDSSTKTVFLLRLTDIEFRPTIPKKIFKRQTALPTFQFWPHYWILFPICS